MLSPSRIGAAHRNGHGPSAAAGGTNRLEPAPMPPAAPLLAPQGAPRWRAALRRWWRWGLAGIVSALLVVGWLLAGGLRHPEPPPRPERQAVAAKGRVEGADREVSLRPETGGTLAVLHVQVGQVVQKSELLFELSNAVEKERVRLAQAQLKVAEAQFELGKSDWQRAQNIRSGYRGAISEQDYEAAASRKLVAQARVDEAQAQVKLAEAELAKTQVRAPAAGEILQIYARVGEMVGRESPDPVLKLVDMSVRRVRAWVDELHVARVRTGQRALVTGDGFPGQEFTGRVVAKLRVMGKSAPRSDEPGEYVDLYDLEVVIDLEGGRELPIGYRVQVRIEEEEQSWPAVPGKP